MQSHSSATDQDFVGQTTTEDAFLSRHHGRDNRRSSDSSLSDDEGGGIGLRFGAGDATSNTFSQVAPLNGHLALGRSSPTEAPSPLSRNRIAEYEEAYASWSKRRSEGPGFDVVNKSRKPGDKRSPISELPNEILTHALAHLSPTDLSSISLVSRRFHELVTTPHAWRSAFARYFPGPDSINVLANDSDDEVEDVLRTERRAFTRVTALASWRSEYILRTRLLRSLGRGKPVQPIASAAAARSGQNHAALPIVMYNSQLYTTVNHLHATFGTGLNKRLPRFVHGADDVGTASSSDPAAAKIDSWGMGDPSTFISFADRFPGDAQYGLGFGEIVGVPNAMDVSQPHGMVLGEGMPDGVVYYRYAEEMRGRFLAASSGLSAPELGIPKVLSTREAICSVWLAKSSSIPSLTDGLVGILAGSSLGVLTSYSLGPLGPRDQRFGRGEMTARWVLSPGVPIIGIAVDEQYSIQRQAQNRIWAVALNALGEIFYLAKFPKRAPLDRPTTPRMDDELREKAAWLTGRSVYWTMAEPTRRSARPDPYGELPVDGSYSPRTSWNGMCLGREQLKAETREIEAYIGKRPKDFQRSCLGWDMRRRLEVDFAGDDGNGAGESVLVLACGLDEDSVALVNRFTRCRVKDTHTPVSDQAMPSLRNGGTGISTGKSSLFGGAPVSASNSFDETLSGSVKDYELSQEEADGTSTPRPMSEEWRESSFALGGLKAMQLLTTTMDCSTFASLTTLEDPLLGFSGVSSASSPSMTPMSQGETASSPADIPGQRARFVAAGTKTGAVLIWNIRAPASSSADIINTVEPVRIIYTDSPQISCLGLTSLCLVHGGNDGLVQAWDPLASSMTPIRTLNSRFSSRARRRLVQAQASPQGVGINLFAAGAICLDPDPTVLRGMVSLGTHLRYWSYSSSAADQYKSHKRRLRRSERGSNSGGERVAGAPRGNIKNFIANEQAELDLEEERRRREDAHMAGRFGTELLGSDASEEELLAYAALLSQESLASESRRRTSNGLGAGASAAGLDGVVETASSGRATAKDSPALHASPLPEIYDETDADIAEAIRQSLALTPREDADMGYDDHNSITNDLLDDDDTNMGFNVPIKFAKNHKGSTSRRNSPPKTYASEGSNAKELTDLEFALQLSLAEEQSRRDVEGAGDEIFPALTPSGLGGWSGDGAAGKGKGRA